MYRNKEVAGQACQPLCNKNTLHYDKCSNYKRGKKVIFLTCDACEKYGPVRVVLKTKSELTERETLELFYDEDGELTPEGFKFVVNIMHDSVKLNFGRPVDGLSERDDILTFLWGYNYDIYVKENGRNASSVAIQSIWSVVQQLEYTFYKIYEGYSFVPKLYGTCGPVYITEYTPPGDALKSEVSIGWSIDWSYRAKIAVSLLKLLETIDSKLHQTLHLCDVKGENFGLNRANQATLVDTDSVFFQDSLMSQMQHSNCTQNKDCDFFDCRGLCDTITNKCLEIRTNNNLQVS